jgi:hypothetical protein
MKCKHLSLGSAALILAINSHAQSVATEVLSSTTGFGEINLIPGDNVSDFIIYGQTSPYAGTIGAPISTTVSGDGVVTDLGGYAPSWINWVGANPALPGGASGNTYEVDLKSVEPIGSAYGSSVWTTASFQVTAPAPAFSVDILVHGYQASANLQIDLGGTIIDNYDNIMSSGTGNDDFIFDEKFTGFTAGNLLTFNFYDLAGTSSNAEIDLAAATVNLKTLPEVTPIVLTNTPVPEPGTLALSAVGSLLAWTLLRRKSRAS